MNRLSTLIGNVFPLALATAVYPENAKLSATSILGRGISALGGLNTLENLKGISYHSNVLRSQTLEESEAPGSPDTGVIVQGTQTLSYDLSSSTSDVIQRIDKLYTISDFFNFARPLLGPFNVSLVVRGGVNGYACYVKGNEHDFNPPDNAFGYTDASILHFRWAIFDGLSEDQIAQTGSQLKPTPAGVSREYGSAEAYENSENLAWYGPYAGSVETLNVTRPVAGLSNLYSLVFEGSIYTCMLSHHHHDHSYGAADFVEVSAVLVVPKGFETYWKNIPRVKFALSE
ncbi:hypothetical protein V8C42DRAFT_349098 [Trichoderma barbatum]